MIKNKHVDIIIKNASQLVTAASDIPKTGVELQNLGIIEDGALGIFSGIISCIGKTISVPPRTFGVSGEKCGGRYFERFKINFFK